MDPRGDIKSIRDHSFFFERGFRQFPKKNPAQQTLLKKIVQRGALGRKNLASALYYPSPVFHFKKILHKLLSTKKIVYQNIFQRPPPSKTYFMITAQSLARSLDNYEAIAEWIHRTGLLWQWWRNWLSITGQTHERLKSNLFFTITNCQIVRSRSLPLRINYKFICLSAYWR